MRFIAAVARPVLRLMMRVEVEGSENIPDQGPAIIAANHFSWWEPPAIIASIFRPVYFIAANDFRWDLRIRWIVRLYGSIPVNRNNFERKTVNIALQKLKDQQLVGIFPQGGMQQTEITDAKPGVVFMAFKADVPIIPVGISGQIDPSRYWKRLRRPRIKVRIGRPFRLKTLEGNWAQNKEYANEMGRDLMAHIAVLVDPEYRGNYAEHPIVKNRVQS